MENSQKYKALVCPVCFSAFDEKDKMPLLMKECGHTFCKDCIGKHLGDKGLSSIKCFSCRRESSLSENDLEMSQFPINYAILGTLTETEVAQSVEAEKPSDVCNKHLLPATLICLDSHTTSDRIPICAKCALQFHKNCNETAVVEITRLKEKTCFVPLELEVTALRTKLKNSIENNLNSIKDRQFKFVDNVCDFLQKETDFVKSCDTVDAVLSNLPKLSVRIDKDRQIVVLSHPKHYVMNQLFDDLEKLYSDDGMWKQLRFCELDETISGFKQYLSCKEEKRTGDLELLTRINRADPFIVRNYVLPKLDVSPNADIISLFEDLKKIWNPQSFEKFQPTVIRGQKHSSLEKIINTVKQEFSSEEFHSNVGRLNHSIFKKLNFSLKNFFIKPLGFISCNLSSKFRDSNLDALDDRIVLLKMNEVCIKVRV